MGTKHTEGKNIKGKLLVELYNTLYFESYWFRKAELATSRASQSYCINQANHYHNLRAGLFRACVIADIEPSTPKIFQRGKEGVAAANSEAVNDGGKINDE